MCQKKKLLKVCVFLKTFFKDTSIHNFIYFIQIIPIPILTNHYYFQGAGIVHLVVLTFGIGLEAVSQAFIVLFETSISSIVQKSSLKEARLFLSGTHLGTVCESYKETITIVKILNFPTQK